MTDEQVLAQAMGKCWHEGSFDRETRTWARNPAFTTPAELWDLLMYMVGREDYNDFDKMLWYKYHGEVMPSDYLKWLLTATYQDKGKEKLLFVKLCADWCRDHEEARS